MVAVNQFPANGSTLAAFSTAFRGTIGPTSSGDMVQSTFEILLSGTPVITQTVTQGPFGPASNANVQATIDVSGLTDGTTYTWQFSYVKTNNPLENGTSTPTTFTYRKPPVATVSAPSGSQLLSNPNITGTLSSSPRSVTQLAVEVQRVSGSVSVWTPGYLAVSGSSYSIPYAGPALSSGVNYRVRTRPKDSSGYEGNWTGWSTFSIAPNAAPTATAISPIGGATVSTTTPTLTLGFSDADTGQLGRFDAYQVQVRRVSDETGMLDTGTVATSGGEQSARQVTLVYAGSALSNGTDYEWRGRVQDGGALWSDYTPWQTFTPQLVPNAPTGIEPAGLINTLTPTIKAVYSQGSGATEAGYQYEIRQGTTTIYQSGDVSGAIGTGQAYGTSNAASTPSSAPALAWGTNYGLRMRSKDSDGAYGPWSSWVDFATNSAPTTPTGLQPSGAVIGDTTPTLAWTHNDPNGDAQTKAKIELREASSGTPVSGYDPKELTQAGGTHDVTETLTDDPPTAYRWRVATMGTSGPGYGPWSDEREFTVAIVPTVSMTSPTPDEELTVPGGAVTWSFAGGSGTQQDWRYRVYAADGATVVYDTNVTAGTAMTAPRPAWLANLSTYFERVTVRDTLGQEGDTGLVRITTNWTPPATVVGLTALAVGSQADALGFELPAVALSWDPVSTAYGSFLRYVVYRREGSGDLEAVATISARESSTYEDYEARADTVLGYVVTQVAEIGGAEVESLPSAEAQASITIHWLFVHDRGSPEHFAALPIPQQRVTTVQDVTYQQPWGRTAATAYFGDADYDVVDVQGSAPWEGDDELTAAVWRAVQVLRKRQRENGSVLVARQGRDVHMVCQIDSSTRDDSPALYSQSLRLRQVDPGEE